MLPQQPTTSIVSTRSSRLIDRVLRLRRQLGIDISLSLRDPEEMLPSPGEDTFAMETLREASPVYNHRDWLTWSQSPCEGKLPEKKGQEELQRCP